MEEEHHGVRKTGYTTPSGGDTGSSIGEELQEGMEMKEVVANRNFEEDGGGVVSRHFWAAH